MFKVLSIDGGGIRGVIPSVLLNHIEDNTGKSVAELFDLIVGTSTGGILATALTKKDGGNNHKAKDMVEFYTNHGGEIFERSAWRAVSSLGGLIDERYDHEPLENLLDKYLDDFTLSACDPPIVATSYDIEKREPYFFKTTKARGSPERDHYLRHVARATSAGPTYFEPARIPDLATPPHCRALVDGGVFVNNPAMCGYVEARSTFKKGPDDILLVSLDTGKATRSIKYDEAKDWGAPSWIHPLISVMMDGTADAADYHLGKLMPSSGTGQRYFRFKTPLKYGKDDMDDATYGNIRNLKERAEELIATNASEFQRLMTQL